MSEPVLYQWPPAAKFGRVVPKTKFYEHGTVTARVRGKFVADLQRITWAYKLADETIHLRGDATVPEIQVFVIDVKAGDISDVVLAAIDKAVPFPIIFEINCERGGETQTRMTACHKQLGDPRPKLSTYFSNRWLPANATRSPLPPALDLASLYSGLMTSILPIAVRAGERLSEATERVSQARKLEREIATLERRLQTEPQLNRKVELRRELRDREATLTALTDLASTMGQNRPDQNTPDKDAQWTS